jgi:hypothetical protein
MLIVTSTSDLIFDKPDIVEWRNEEVVSWISQLGLEKYATTFREQKIDGIQFIKCNPYDFTTRFNVKETKDLKVLLKSIDFLRIFVKLRKDCQDFIDIEKTVEEDDHKLQEKHALGYNNENIQVIEEENKEATVENVSLNENSKESNLREEKNEVKKKDYENSIIKEHSKTENNNLNNSIINNNPGFYITKLSISILFPNFS